MEFSESLDFGNSTFMNLENLAKNAFDRDESRKSDGGKYVRQLESIGESPESTRGSRSREVGFLTNRVTNNTRGCKYARPTTKDESLNVKFRKTKSDSNLGGVLPDHRSINGQLGSYSDFFRSDFSIEEQNEQVEKLLLKKKTESPALIRISQLKEALEDSCTDVDGDSSNKSSDSSKLDAALFSEDIQALLCDANEHHQLKEFPIIEPEVVRIETQLYPEHLTTAQKQEKRKDQCKFLNDDHNLQIDEASFIGCGNTKEEHNAILEELERSKHEVRRAMLEEPRLDPPSVKSSCTKKTNAQSISKQSLDFHETSRGQGELQNNLNSLRSIANWQIPVSILREYERKGIRNMFDWQIECLSNPKVIFNHKNLVYSAPTSAGKTLVSEILLIKTIAEREKKVLLILPFISVVREKMLYLQDLLQPSGYRVEGFFGGYTPPGGFDSINVAICTIEKANAIVNKLLEQGKLGDIGTVIVDEVHLISDPSRGYILELLLAKILYMSWKNLLCIQVVTMSATLSNVNLLQRWLQAELYVTTFRPVALQEMIKIGNKIFDNNMKQLRELKRNENYGMIENDGEQVAQLCIETLLEGCSAIVFCPSKDWCEKLTTQLASAIHALGKSGSELGLRLRATLKRENIDELKRKLKDIPTGLDATLERTITFGCAFHHAGMTLEERDLIEAGFKSGALRIIVATSTLSSGVNLPARRVLIRTPLFGGKAMSSLTYRQMIGRAGRTGKDTLGESILVCTESNARIGRELITAGLNPITSCLEMESSVSGTWHYCL